MKVFGLGIPELIMLAVFLVIIVLPLLVVLLVSKLFHKHDKSD